ncbi:MAG TPA: serine hydrolase domain-containing protein [Anaerolineales bacterium]|nr:serine hydrolase domain-containing protein [Anaerolineales bacterium]
MMELVAPESVGIASERLAAIDAAMQAYIDQGRFAGISTLIACKGKVIHFGRYGKLDISRAAPIQADSLFRIYSLTKPIISVAALMLYEDGLFDLDQPVYKWIPEFKNFRVWQESYSINGATSALETDITFRHLFTHTAGLGYGWGEPTDPVDKIYQEAQLINWTDLRLHYPLSELVRRVSALPLRTQPGAMWHYSLSHDVIGYLIETISGKTCETFLRERLFNPLGMFDTSFFVPPEKLARFGPLYSYSEQDGLTVFDEVATSPFVRADVIPSGGGGLVSSMPDYYRFMSMLANGGTLDGVRVLKQSTVTMMTTNQLSDSAFPVRFDDPWPGMGYGLGIGVQTLESRQVGWIGISGTTAWWYPQEEMIVIALPQALFNWEASDRLLGMAGELYSI